jgi:hypothetical protein
VPHASNLCRAGSEVMIFSALDTLVLPLSSSLGVDPLSDAYRRRSQSADGGKGGAHHWASDSNLGQLKSDGAGVTHHMGADFDQLQLESGQ